MSRRSVPPGRLVAAAALIALVAGALPASGVEPPIEPVTAQAETTPINESGDGADDPAIWVHPTDPSRSLVFGSNKQGTLESYNLDGTRVQRIAEAFFGNVDVRYGFPLGGTLVDIVVVSRSGVRVYAINPATRLLTNITDGTSISSSGEGLCLYKSPSSGRFYVFHISRGGTVSQRWLRDADADGRVDATLVRTWSIGSESEGCVADDELSAVYVSEEDVGIWRYGAEPSAGTSPAARAAVDTVGAPGHLLADVEGLAVVRQAGGDGFILASVQNGEAGSDDGTPFVTVYRRRPPHQFVGRFQVVAGAVADGCGRTDGIEATSTPLGPLFPNGLFICQDHQNTLPGTSGNQNFKLVRLEAALDLGPAPPAPAVVSAFATHPTAVPEGDGYWMAGVDGRVFAFGAATHHGRAATPPAFPVAGMASTPDGGGYWLATANGEVLNFGNAPDLGDLAGIKLKRPIVGMAATPTGFGFWLVASDGGVFTFGNARFKGSLGAVKLNQPVVGMAPTPSGQGYWLVAADGGIFTFGGAPFKGSTGGKKLNQPIVGMDSTPSGQGYWLVAGDGGVFTFDAPFRGSAAGAHPATPAVALAATPDGQGYWVVVRGGDVFDFGTANDFGSP
ncbi:MAG: phytase [Acidimicrobiia bacterium]